MQYTPFAGLTALDENDPITIDGASFLIDNPRITDHLLQVGAVTHRHDAHAAQANPRAAMTGVAAAGGALDSNSTYALTYTLMDAYGGETTGATPLVLVTGAGGAVPAPTIAPTAVPNYTTGIMPAGTYYYALTYTDGAGGETTIGPSTLVYVDPGYASGSVDLSGLAAQLQAHGGTAVDWRLWRSYEGADWHLVTEGSTDTYVDSGFDPPDNPARPPDASSTGQTNSLTVTLPTAAAEPAIATATAIRIYLAPDTNFYDPCFYEQVPTASAGATLTITGATVTQGRPPRVSNCTPGAAKIDPDTDLLDWTWKRPVATASALPTTGNNDGDVRVTTDTGEIWIWSATSNAWSEWNPVGSVVQATEENGTTYTLALSDSGRVVEFTSATAVTCTIPARATVSFPVGTVIEIFQYGAGQVTIAAAASVTLRSDSGLVKTAAQYASIGLRQRAVDEWVLTGDLA